MIAFGSYKNCLNSFKEMAMPSEALCEDWRGLVDQFLNGSIKFEVSLQRVLTTFSALTR